MQLKPGVKLLEENIGDGELVVRQNYYALKIRISLHRGDIVKAPNDCLSHVLDDNILVHDDGYFEHKVRISREGLVPGIFYAIDRMRIGGYRKVEIAPHLAYKEYGIPGVIPEKAMLTVEIKILRTATSG